LGACGGSIVAKASSGCPERRAESLRDSLTGQRTAARKMVRSGTGL